MEALRTAGLTLLPVAAALAACSSPRAAVPSTVTVTGAELGSSSNDDAVMRTTTARCERELACNKIGQGRAYEDQPTCLERIGALMDEEAGRNACPLGIDPFALSVCLYDIRRTPCGGELEHRTNLESCTKLRLCAR